MAHHKRKRPENRRAGCLLCKPWTVHGFAKDRVDASSSLTTTAGVTLTGNCESRGEIRRFSVFEGRRDSVMLLLR
jgi:hypothetical protein